MTFSLPRNWQLFLVAILFTGLIGCSDSDNDGIDFPPEPPVEPPVEPELTYDAEIVWTEYGIPHVRADDWEIGRAHV